MATVRLRLMPTVPRTADFPTEWLREGRCYFAKFVAALQRHTRDEHADHDALLALSDDLDAVTTACIEAAAVGNAVEATLSLEPGGFVDARLERIEHLARLATARTRLKAGGIDDFESHLAEARIADWLVDAVAAENQSAARAKSLAKVAEVEHRIAKRWPGKAEDETQP